MVGISGSSACCFISTATTRSSSTAALLANRARRNTFFPISCFPTLNCSRRFSRGSGLGGGGGAIRSPDLVDLEYSHLNLKEIPGGVGHVRIRQHVNPLSASLTIPAEMPNWQEVFKEPGLPLMVDIGSGSGRFLIWLAKRFPESRNYLGLEIRHKLVERSLFWVKELALANICFLFANAMVSFEQLVSSYPGPLTFVSILCPDPHFKKRHHKRRTVQKPLVDSISKHLSPGGQVLLQSDVLEVALDMRYQFDARSDEFEHVDAVDPSISCDA